jgi:hypothetical protein
MIGEEKLFFLFFVYFVLKSSHIEREEKADRCIALNKNER